MGSVNREVYDKSKCLPWPRIDLCRVYVQYGGTWWGIECALPGHTSCERTPWCIAWKEFIDISYSVSFHTWDREIWQDLWQLVSWWAEFLPARQAADEDLPSKFANRSQILITISPKYFWLCTASKASGETFHSETLSTKHGCRGRGSKLASRMPFTNLMFARSYEAKAMTLNSSVFWDLAAMAASRLLVSSRLIGR